MIGVCEIRLRYDTVCCLEYIPYFMLVDILTLGPIPLRNLSSQIKWYDSSFSFLSKFQQIDYCKVLHQIATEFCTCHDSSAVMACAKFCSNLLTLSNTNFPLNLSCDQKVVSEMTGWVKIGLM